MAVMKGVAKAVPLRFIQLLSFIILAAGQGSRILRSFKVNLIKITPVTRPRWRRRHQRVAPTQQHGQMLALVISAGRYLCQHDAGRRVANYRLGKSRII